MTTTEKQVIAYVTVVIPVTMAYDEGEIPSADVLRQHAIENAAAHPALTNAGDFAMYVDEVRTEIEDNTWCFDCENPHGLCICRGEQD